MRWQSNEDVVADDDIVTMFRDISHGELKLSFLSPAVILPSTVPSFSKDHPGQGLCANFEPNQISGAFNDFIISNQTRFAIVLAVKWANLDDALMPSKPCLITDTLGQCPSFLTLT